MNAFTTLELAVLDAIAEEATTIAPELPGQIADAVVSNRVNTGQGFITSIAVDASRSAAVAAPDGGIGSIHADIGGVSQPVAFSAVIRRGFLTALECKTYDEDTRAIDFATADFGGLFRLDSQGESIPIVARVPIESQLHRLQREEAWDPFPDNSAGVLARPFPLTRDEFAIWVRDHLVKFPQGLNLVLAIGHPLSKPKELALNVATYVIILVPFALLLAPSYAPRLVPQVPIGILLWTFPPVFFLSFLLNLRKFAMRYREAYLAT